MNDQQYEANSTSLTLLLMLIKNIYYIFYIVGDDSFFAFLTGGQNEYAVCKKALEVKFSHSQNKWKLRKINLTID